MDMDVGNHRVLTSCSW